MVEKVKLFNLSETTSPKRKDWVADTVGHYQ